MKITRTRFNHDEKEGYGYCPNCKGITYFDGFPPCYDDYLCEECNKHDVMELQAAVDKGYIIIDEDN